MNEFRPVFIEATTLDDCWHQLLWQTKEKGRRYKITSGSYEGQERLALDYASGFIHYPHERPLAPRMPETSPLPPPTTDDEIEQYFVNYLMDIQLQPNEHYRYSSWIVGGNKICETKQLDWVIEHLKESPGNEHCYVVVGTPEWSLGYNEPYRECPTCKRMFNWKYDTCPYHPNAELIVHEHLRKTSPCLRGLDFRIIDGRLLTCVVYRSWHTLAFPTNMGGFTLLNEYVAQEIGVEPGPLAFSCKSLHIYEQEFDYLEARFGN